MNLERKVHRAKQAIALIAEADDAPIAARAEAAKAIVEFVGAAMKAATVRAEAAAAAAKAEAEAKAKAAA